VSAKPTVLEVLRRFLPAFLAETPTLSPQQWRAIWAITHCRTPTLGADAFFCKLCNRVHLAYHSCNHKACPQCGHADTAAWIQRELAKRINAPYFLVTFTLPAQLRAEFFGPKAKQAYELFFAAVSAALTEKLATDKGLRAPVNGFIAALHTWTQRLEVHLHIHCLVPGAGLNAKGRPVRVKKADFLVYLPHLQAAFRKHMRDLLEENQWQVDPVVWTKEWGVDIQPAGSGVAALKYLGAYVRRTAISDRRMISMNATSVCFHWKDRSDHNRSKTLELPGVEFVRRYLRHVLPRGLRSVRYYGFCHPAAKLNRMRLQFETGMPLQLGATADAPKKMEGPRCPNCGALMQSVLRILPPYQGRAPPIAQPASIAQPTP
jgi:hypothetical protein